MSSSSLDQQRKQLEYLMKKKPNISLNDNEEKHIDNGEDITKNKPQKRSFDYSNYIRNKRHQLDLSKQEKEKLKTTKEEEEHMNKQKYIKDALVAKTAKKRAARQKKLQKQKQNKLKVKESLDASKPDAPATDVQQSNSNEDLMRVLHEDEELKELGI